MNKKFWSYLKSHYFCDGGRREHKLYNTIILLYYYRRNKCFSFAALRFSTNLAYRAALFYISKSKLASYYKINLK